ncbi:YbhB/YbcL family Raf kinase inhibitor-like protein [Propionibacterium sp.]|uniref:YbhB/YbcL family Raf kinase inhibitor-like protein n=1 Tax=Propionibacterium sp. TaxID=1977903 RepID=UPI0039EB3A60
MQLHSDDLAEGEQIPLECAEPKAGGKNVLPQLSWSGVPRNAKSLALTVWDPDAPREGGYWHWLALDIPPETTEVPHGGSLPEGCRELDNDYGYKGYGGPCPPHDETHRYIFIIWALDVATLDVPDDAKPADVEKELGAHLIEAVKLIPVFTSTL